MIILGIDPGTMVMGFGILKAEKSKVEVITLSVLDFKDCKTHYEKLGKIFEYTTDIISRFQPEVLSIEAPFFGKNVQSMLKLGRAQGVAIAAALTSGLEVFEYSPLKIKMAITGNGAASKEQVSDMLHRFLKIPELYNTLKLDATDALGAAYCHYLQQRNPIADKPYRNWNDFITKNEKRVRK